MTPRERILATVNFEETDVLPVHDQLWQQVPGLWSQQGMPEDVFPPDHFGFDVAEMFLDTSPRFEQRILHRADGFVTYTDRYGYTCKKLDGASGTLEFSDPRTRDRAAWEETKKRMAPRDDDPRARIDDVSYFAHFSEYPSWDEAREKYRNIREAGRYVLFDAYGPWEATWRHRGYEHLLMDLAMEEDWVAEMTDTYSTLLRHTLQQCVRHGIQPDGFCLIEDLGCNQGLMFSPATWRNVFRANLEILGQFLRDNGIHFWMHSCGNVTRLLADLIECGVQVLNPLQVSAGMDASALSETYGNNLAWWGNLSTPAMSGPQEPLEEEIRRRVALARTRGGYIFGSDHSVPPKVSYARYQWILKTAREAFRSIDKP